MLRVEMERRLLERIWMIWVESVILEILKSRKVGQLNELVLPTRSNMKIL